MITRDFSVISMTSQASLSLSLLLTKVTHAQYRKRFRASYNRAVDRYRARSYRSKRHELQFAEAVHSPIAVHGPITVQPEFFKFPRRNVPLGICLSTDFSAFSSFRRETCESTSLSALIFVPFQEQTKVWRNYLASSYGA